MFIVYEHKNTLNNKKYIGYTSKTMNERLHKHYINAISGMDNHFYKAIRKYGLEVFESKILETVATQLEATNLEVKHIELNNSFKEGYNMTKGGDGGYVVPAEKRDDWIKKLTASSTKENNGMWSGISDETILSYAREFFLSEGHSSGMQSFINYGVKKYSIPKSYSKNRFGGKTLKQAYCEKYNVNPTELKYVKSAAHREKLKNANIGKNWYSNDNLKTSYQANSLPGNDWYKGRNYGY